jgi:hypothetical protein
MLSNAQLATLVHNNLATSGLATALRLAGRTQLSTNHDRSLEQETRCSEVRCRLQDLLFRVLGMPLTLSLQTLHRDVSLELDVLKRTVQLQLTNLWVFAL